MFCAPMSRDLPPELATLLAEHEPARRDAAWDGFVARYSKLLLLISHQFGGSHDDAMDRYAAILEQLRADDFRRLRAWQGDRRSALTTWLGVVARRVCLDELRRRYGRVDRTSDADEIAARRQRRRLVDLITEELVPDLDMPDAHGAVADAELAVRRSELRERLGQCVTELLADDQLLLALRFRDDRSAAEIASIIGLPSAFHVYRRLGKLASQLRDALRRRGVEDPVP
jgi:RNA polymerase sigma factor (sigma-70 family)